MNVNDKKWFRSMGAEKLMEAEEREKKEKKGLFDLSYQPHDMHATEVMINAIQRQAQIDMMKNAFKKPDTVVVDKDTGKKMILLSVSNYAILAGKDGEIRVRDLQEVKVLLSDEQKRLLE